MIETIKKLLVKYRELIVYVIVGGITTVINWGVSFLLDAFVFDSSVPLQNTIINVIAWFVAVVASFPMNRKWVFQSKNPNWVGEFFGFTASRLTTLGIEELVMLLCVNVFGISFRSVFGGDPAGIHTQTTGDDLHKDQFQIRSPRLLKLPLF